MDILHPNIDTTGQRSNLVNIRRLSNAQVGRGRPAGGLRAYILLLAVVGCQALPVNGADGPAATRPAQEPAASKSTSATSNAGSFDGRFLYAGDFGGGCIYKISPHGSAVVYASGITAPCGLVFDEDGTLFVAGGESIWRITPTPDGSPATEENGHVKRFVSGLAHAKGLARDPAGNFWVTEYFVNELLDENGRSFAKPKFVPGGLYRIAPDGAKTTVDAPLTWPYSLTTAPNGDILLAQLSGFQLVRYASSGQKRVIDEGVFWLRHAIYDAEGNIYAMGGKGITKIARDGSKRVFCDFAADEYGATHSIGLALDARGTLYSSDWIKQPQGKPLGVIYKYAPDGSRTLFTKVGHQPAWLEFYPSSPRAVHAKPAAQEQIPSVNAIYFGNSYTGNTMPGLQPLLAKSAGRQWAVEMLGGPGMPAWTHMKRLMDGYARFASFKTNAPKADTRVILIHGETGLRHIVTGEK